MIVKNYCLFLNCLLLVDKIFLVMVTHSIERRELGCERVWYVEAARKTFRLT